MSGWTNQDAHGNAPLFALAQVQKAPTASNMGAAGSGKLLIMRQKITLSMALQ